jgi:hypothetical protein
MPGRVRAPVDPRIEAVLSANDLAIDTDRFQGTAWGMVKPSNTLVAIRAFVAAGGEGAA